MSANFIILQCISVTKYMNVTLQLFNQKTKKSCRRRTRTFTERFVLIPYNPEPEFFPFKLLFLAKLHTKNKSPFSTLETGGHVCQFHHPTIISLAKYMNVTLQLFNQKTKKSCRRRTRTFTERFVLIPYNPEPEFFPFKLLFLAELHTKNKSSFSTLETGGHVCQFHHPTILKRHYLKEQKS